MSHLKQARTKPKWMNPKTMPAKFKARVTCQQERGLPGRNVPPEGDFNGSHPRLLLSAHPSWF